MAPKLEKCFTMRGYLSMDASHQLGTMKGGPQRIIVPISSGFIEGSGLKAEIRPGGGDWQLLDTTTNVANLDVRLNARTSDGHSMHLHYTGVLKMDEKAGKAVSGGPEAKTTDFGDHEWWTAPTMETSDERFKWIESSFWVGQGRFVVDEQGVAVEYQIFKVVN